MQTHNNLSNEHKLVAGVGAGFVRREEYEGKVGKQPPKKSADANLSTEML